ncbi:MAG TPA: hypothetical protein PKD92_04730, partial [Novosphingobium sp.]|nr:hypothetical protein [Novosphingobium sp.]
MRQTHLILAAGLAALATGCASKPGAGPSPASEAVVTGQKAGDYAALPAPPPPVSMPAPTAHMERGMMVGIPPVMVANDPGRERYDGKDVSPVKLTR